MEPRELSVDEKDWKITILWSDGHRGLYDPFNLRRGCPCAMCQGEPGIFGKHYCTPRQAIQAEVRPQEIKSVGRYGIKIVWSDGHDLGIYSFDYLRKICECKECV